MKIYLAKIKKRISKIQLVSRLSQLAHARSFGLDYVACSSLGALCSLKPCKTDSQLANNLWRKLLSSRTRDRPRLKPHLLHASGQTHYKKYFHKSWREGVRHRAKRLFLGLPLARAVRLSYQRTYSLHEPRVLAIYSSPSLTEIVVLPKLRKKRDLQL